jgi:hypothetical protein
VVLLLLLQNMDGSGGWGNFTGVSVDERGVVTKLADNQKAGTMMIRDLLGHIPAGKYTILYDGTGVIDCSMVGGLKLCIHWLDSMFGVQWHG